MKYLLFLLFLGATFMAQAQDPIITDEYIEVQFGKKTTQEDLDSIKAALKERNIDIEYTNTEFKGKKLKAISFKVDCNDGHSGSASSKTLLVAKIGFARDYREGAEVTFSTGSIK